MKKTLAAALFLIPFAAFAADAPAIPNYSKTFEELDSLGSTGGVGGSGNAKVQVVTILGDPSKPGPYSQLLKVQAGAKIPAHHHEGDRVGTVLKGTWHFGYGSKFNESALHTLKAGSVYTEPSNAPHFAMTAETSVVVLLTGFGPTDTVYENPLDEPKK
ncbi:cupin domain-containing protein [Pararhizobium sp. PWRC1-1]|uniref:cupin domain-containing protein n=1 Tax=Pararhizobium sp. PWRC1-1 TaxID=2804566 RepID=UPI003CEC391F